MSGRLKILSPRHIFEKQGMQDAGLSAAWAESYMTMGKAIREGKLQEDYWKNKPAHLGKYKLEDFARDFAAVYLNA